MEMLTAIKRKEDGRHSSGNKGIPGRSEEKEVGRAINWTINTALLFPAE